MNVCVMKLTGLECDAFCKMRRDKSLKCLEGLLVAVCVGTGSADVVTVSHRRCIFNIGMSVMGRGLNLGGVLQHFVGLDVCVMSMNRVQFDQYFG